MMRLEFNKDIYNKNIIIDQNNFQVMMEWEKPYMKALVDRLNPTGHVLEIGFGLGYSSTYIQKYKIKSHTIIESNKEVIKKLKLWKIKQKHPVNIIEGTWQDKLNILKKFDSIFFDDSPHDDHKDNENIRIYDFYYKILKNHVNKNSKMVWYLDKPIYWVSHPSTEWSMREFKIKIPDNCKYTPTKNKVYLPLITFLNGTIKDITPVVFNKFNEFKILNGI
jgi:hypothetical protein